MTNVPTGMVLRAELLAAGHRPDEVRRMTRDAAVVRRGAYVAYDDERLRRPERAHELAVFAAAAQLGPHRVVSHVSAAVLLGIAVWGVPLDRVHITRPGCGGGRRSRHLHLHVTALEPDELAVAQGISVTAPARTVADLLRTLPLEQATVVADSALFRKLVTRAEVAAELARAPRRHGTGAALRALAFADGRAESAGESRSRVRMRAAGLPPPDLQVRVVDAERSRLGRVDFLWRNLGVVGEFDGLVKYGRLLKPGQSPADAVVAEKVREDAIRDTGLRVVRWIWDELDPFETVAGRLRRALAPVPAR